MFLCSYYSVSTTRRMKEDYGAWQAEELDDQVQAGCIQQQEQTDQATEMQQERPSSHARRKRMTWTWMTWGLWLPRICAHSRASWRRCAMRSRLHRSSWNARWRRWAHMSEHNYKMSFNLGELSRVWNFISINKLYIHFVFECLLFIHYLVSAFHRTLNACTMTNINP